MEKMITIKGIRVILNVQHSGIGYAYPRLFIERSKGDCVNLDVSICALFKMKQEDFDDWASEAEVVTEVAAFDKLLEEVNIKVPVFHDIIRQVIEGEDAN